MMYSEKSAENRINIMRIRDIAESALVVIVVLMFCIAMTIPAKHSQTFGAVFDFMMLMCIIYGMALIVIKRKENDKIAVILTAAYFVTRIASYHVNSLPVTYGGTIMLQMFYLIGINRHFICNNKRIKAALYAFLAFDVAAILICYFQWKFRPEAAQKMVDPYIVSGGTIETSLFQNPNYAGMMSGAAAVICLALIANSRISKKVCVILIPVAALSLHMLFMRSGCRSGQLGFILVCLLAALMMAVKKLDSVKWITELSLVVCFALLIPLCVLIYTGDNEKAVSDVSAVEQTLDYKLTGRYAIWKSTILSQKGNWILGYGNNKRAWSKRSEYIEERTDPETIEYYYMFAAEHKRQHNGYVALLNEAGLAGLVTLLTLLLYRIRALKGRFRDGAWEKLLLVYIFWINIFEAKFILQQFFTGLLMMMFLMPGSGEDDLQNE